ncbi:MAG: phosphoribosyltransferase family protein [Archaeoglobaceae archaeon]
MGVSLSLKTGKPLVIFRKQKKEYGLGDDRIGSINLGDRFVLVEDVITTGKSAISAIERIEKAGGRVLKILAVVDRGESEIKFESVLKLSELLKAKDLLQSSQG